MKDRDSMKKILLIVCLIIPLMFTGCNKTKEETPIVKEDETVRVFNDQVVEQVIIQDHNVAYYDNYSHIALTLYNENNSDTNVENLKISYYRDKVLVYSVTKSVGTIKSNQTYKLELSSDLNLATCNKVKYEIVK